MAAPKGEETALGSARGRFIESLPRKAIELRGAIALLTATPAADGPREDMRRRLHTLYASALVFRNDVLAASVKEGLELLDASRDQNRSLTHQDLDALTRLVKRLPELRGELPFGAPPAAAATLPSGTSTRPTTWSGAPGASIQNRPPPATPSSPPQTLTGLAPITLPPPADATANSSRGLTMGGGVRAAAVPAALTSKSHKAPLLQMVVHVLALARLEELTQLQGLLPGDSFELTATSSVDQALAAARAHAPDVVLADRDLAAEGELIRRLRSDPLTDFVPVVLVQSRDGAIDALAARDAGADDVLLRPLDTDSVTRALGAVTGTLLEESTGLLRLGDATLDEVADRVAEEIRRGIVDAAERGRDLKIPMGEGAEVLAAAWAAVARVRAFVAQQSGGRVHFADRPRRGGPALLALVGGESVDDPLALVGTLNGRRVLVVDDDPAVVWFFAGLLREEGATVIETTDGREALRAARTQRPDVVISDILMPHLDGFALCRELKRDPALIDVPVILISWKEDLLHRMRELSAGASGYLRKESGAAQILERVREVLRPRTQLEAQLKAGGEVRGSLEGTGIVPLLRSVRRARTSARVTIRDAWNLFECEIRDGKLAQLTRTASDGSFSRGEHALPQLLGANAGRFVVTDSETHVRPMFEGTLDDALHRGARALGAVIDAVSGASLMRTERIMFDDEAYTILLKQSPGPVREIVERLHDGEAPSMLLATGVSAQTLESVLMDLARRGAVREVHAKDGEDLIAAALKTRDGERPTRFASPHSIIPPAPNPVISMRPVTPDPAAEHGLPSVLDPFASFEAAAHARASDGLDPLSDPAPAMPGKAGTWQGKISHATSVSISAPAEHVMPAPPSFERVPDEEEQPTDQFDPMSREQADRVMALAKRKSEPPLTPSEPPAPEGAAMSYAVEPVEPAEPPAAAESEASEVVPALTSQPSAAPTQVSESARERAAFAAASQSMEPDAMAAIEDRRSRGTIAAWALAMAVLIAVGFWAERASESSGPGPGPGRLRVVGDPHAASKTTSPSVKDLASEQASGAPTRGPGPSDPQALPRADLLVAPEDSGFVVHAGILDSAVAVTPQQGLLVVEAAPGAPNAVLTIDERRIGELPAKVALDEGVHELAISRGDRTSYRYLSVRPGKSWVLKAL